MAVAKSPETRTKKPNNEFDKTKSVSAKFIISVRFFSERRCEKLFVPFRAESSNAIWCGATRSAAIHFTEAARLLLFPIILYIYHISVPYFLFVDFLWLVRTHLMAFLFVNRAHTQTLTAAIFHTCRCRELIERASAYVRLQWLLWVWCARLICKFHFILWRRIENNFYEKKASDFIFITHLKF